MIYLALGSNLGKREENLRRAIRELRAQGVAVKRESSWYETAPQEISDQPWFLNMIAECETELTPEELLRTVLTIEREIGRVRAPQTLRYGPRAIDIDLVFYGEESRKTDDLTLPHPRWKERHFVLAPLRELRPDLVTDELLEKVKSQTVRRRERLAEDEEIRNA